LITDAALVTVCLSVLAHGATSWWGSNAYADQVEAHEDAGQMVEDMPSAPVRVPRHPVGESPIIESPIIVCM